MAYDEARAALREQGDTLTNVRNRATGVLAAAAVATSFSATAGLLNTDRGSGDVFPAWGAWLLLAILVIIAVGVMVVLWPAKSWVYGPQPSQLLSKADHELDDVLTIATRAMVVALTSNASILGRRVTAYRLTASAVLIEVTLLVLILIVVRG